MKAFLLVGGLGTRLRPITDTIPKCMVEIAGRPLIDWWLENLILAGVTEVLVNLHHFADIVKAHLTALKLPIKFIFYHEEILLGSAGTLRENADFVNGESAFLVVYGDNLTNFNLREFINCHYLYNPLMTIALFRTDKPKQCGIIELDANDVVIDFVEKPENPKSNLANAGIYIMHPSVLKHAPEDATADIGFDLLPQFINKMRGFITDSYLVDIGTHDNLAKARKEWSLIVNPSK